MRGGGSGLVGVDDGGGVLAGVFAGVLAGGAVGSVRGSLGGCCVSERRSAPQFSQKRLPSSFDHPQFGHAITDLLHRGRDADSRRPYLQSLAPQEHPFSLIVSVRRRWFGIACVPD